MISVSLYVLEVLRPGFTTQKDVHFIFIYFFKDLFIWKRECAYKSERERERESTCTRDSAGERENPKETAEHRASLRDHDLS